MAVNPSLVATVPLQRLFQTGWVPFRISRLDDTSAAVVSRVNTHYAARAPQLFADTAAPTPQRVRPLYAAPFRPQMGYVAKPDLLPPAGNTVLWLASRPPHWSALVVSAPPVAMPGVTARAIALCDADEQPVGLRPEAVAYLQAHYRFADRHQQYVGQLGQHLGQLFDFEALADIRIGPVLAADLRTLAAWAERPERQGLYQGLKNPTPTVWRSLRAVGEALRTAQRSFARHPPPDGESQALLTNYFASAENAYAHLAAFLDQPDHHQPPQDITPRDVVAYAYAALYAPSHTAAYAAALARRQWPALPLFDDFWAWAEVGHALYDLHLHGPRAWRGAIAPGATHYWLGRSPEAWYGLPQPQDAPEVHRQYARCQHIGQQTHRLLRRLIG